MTWERVSLKDKATWREDLQEDTTITDLQKRMISVIAKNWDGVRMTSECSVSFIAKGAGTTIKMVKRYSQSLIETGRVAIAKAPTYTSSTLWSVNWWFRGSAWARFNNGGKPVLDCRKKTHVIEQGGAPRIAQGVVPTDARGWSPELHEGGPQECMGGGPQAGTQFPPKGGYRRPHRGARPYEDAQGAPIEPKPKAGREPGFARWRIVHAQYEGLEEDQFVAHLRSGKASRFVFRCSIDSDEYESLDQALCIDGEPDNLTGKLVMMSVAPGAKTFMRATPEPWRTMTIMSGETHDDGRTVLRCRWQEGGAEMDFPLSPADADGLRQACGSEENAIGATVSYRLLPNDSIEWRPSQNPAEGSTQ